MKIGQCPPTPPSGWWQSCPHTQVSGLTLPCLKAGFQGLPLEGEGAKGRRLRPASPLNPASSCLEAGAGGEDPLAEGSSHWQLCSPAPAVLGSWGTCACFYPWLLPPGTRHKTAVSSGKTVSGEDEMLLGGRRRPQQPSFLWALLVTFCSSLLISICLKVAQDLLSFVNPQLLRSDHMCSGAHPPLGSGGWLDVPED